MDGPERGFGQLFLDYNGDSGGCLTAVIGAFLVPDLENKDAAKMAGLIFVRTYWLENRG